jgi:hypothetical protein
MQQQKPKTPMTKKQQQGMPMNTMCNNTAAAM